MARKTLTLDGVRYRLLREDRTKDGGFTKFSALYVPAGRRRAPKVLVEDKYTNTPGKIEATLI